MATLEPPFRGCHRPRDAKAGDRGSLGARWATRRVRSASQDLRHDTPPGPSRETRERVEHRRPCLLGQCVHQNLVFVDFRQGACGRHLAIMTGRRLAPLSVCLAHSGEWNSPAEHVSAHGDAALGMHWWHRASYSSSRRCASVFPGVRTVTRRRNLDQSRPSRLGPTFGMRRLTRDRLGHSIGQGRNEASRILGGHPKGARADVALPQRNYNGGICRVGRDPHAANVTPGVVEPDSFAIKVALHRHRSIITSAALFGYWGSEKPPAVAPGLLAGDLRLGAPAHRSPGQTQSPPQPVQGR